METPRNSGPQLGEGHVPPTFHQPHLPLGQVSKGVLGLGLSGQRLFTLVHLLLGGGGSCLLLLFPLGLGLLLLLPRPLLLPRDVLFRLALGKLLSWYGGREKVSILHLCTTFQNQAASRAEENCCVGRPREPGSTHAAAKPPRVPAPEPDAP